ncbi:MAG: hypothetical protein M3N25_08325, partial [Actinomycetota bacterium]|nr:hypothetical protein [Actinomycetota bacterium]
TWASWAGPDGAWRTWWVAPSTCSPTPSAITTPPCARRWPPPGYRAGYSFLNGRITAGLDRYRLPRITMGRGQGRPRLAYHLVRSSRSWPDTQSDAVGGPEAG